MAEALCSHMPPHLETPTGLCAVTTPCTALATKSRSVTECACPGSCGAGALPAADAHAARRLRHRPSTRRSPTATPKCSLSRSRRRRLVYHLINQGGKGCRRQAHLLHSCFLGILILRRAKFWFLLPFLKKADIIGTTLCSMPLSYATPTPAFNKAIVGCLMEESAVIEVKGAS